MHIQVLKIGRVAYPEITALASMYEERLGAFAKAQALEAKDDAQALKMIKTAPGTGRTIILLDERGSHITSTQFAERLQKYADDPGIKSILFVVGGPMGLPDSLRELGTFKLSLSKATLTSDMAWLLLWEQIYRAYNILKGTGYHHD